MLRLGKIKLRFYLIDIKELLFFFMCNSGILIIIRKKNFYVLEIDIRMFMGEIMFGSFFESNMRKERNS